MGEVITAEEVKASIEKPNDESSENNEEKNNVSEKPETETVEGR